MRLLIFARGQEANPVFKKLSSLGAHGDESEQEEPPFEEEPPASALHRRRALVPPKLITDGYESANEDVEQHTESSQNSNLLAEPVHLKTRRRSSIVVIPPMQICPGDLLVYSKVLTQRNDLLEASRKNKNTWSLLRLFDRSNRGKADSLCGLEEVLSTLQPSVFIDEQLSKYKDRRSSSIVSGHRLAQLQSESRRSSGQSTTSPASATITSKPCQKHLQRTQTFDSPQSTDGGEDHLLAASAHSTRSNSCIVPVDVNIRRLSGNIDLSEEPTTDAANVNLSVDSGDVVPSGASSTRSSFALTRSEQKRREALWDLLQSECAFLYDHLMILKNVFMEPLKKIQVEGFAMFAEPEVLFGNLDELCCVTYAFCKEFLNVVLQQMNIGELNATEVLVKLFQKSSKATALTQAYHRYTLNYINALNYLETLRRQVEFNEFEKYRLRFMALLVNNTRVDLFSSNSGEPNFEKRGRMQVILFVRANAAFWCCRDPRCKKLQLTDLLVSPVQHIMRVPLILKDIEMRTEDLSERDVITQIIESEENSLRELDDKMKWLKNFERLLEIQRNIVWPAVVDLDPKVFIPEFLKGPLSKQPCERLIVSPRRQIIIEGPLHILDSGKPVEMYVVLFDDMLIITRRKKGLHKKQSSLTEKWASSCSKGNSSTTPHESMFKYVVYKQPLSLDRFYIHDVSATEAAGNKIHFTFGYVC
ncbi:pleckstriny domain-containing family G member 7-like protein [Leptotrombidium deliense]|uniref:Pleckstriny domain-containing family G member 7-like protein n=1 Tax=Leptotrombidium deliense TaxID=299467 RepID=A0A443SVN8_9ACAR|nr:pleckstriny domain-containing family G member 7-like protein [Leptotrombidium deliense]